MKIISSIFTAIITLIVVVLTIIILTAQKTGPFTELYFSNHNELPMNIRLTQSYEFNFTIHNMEHTSRGYHYTAYIGYNNKDIKIMESDVWLSHNQSITIPVAFKIDEPFEEAELSINLNDKKINFWVGQI